ncbi:MAG TPA: hypothetical protein VI874_00095 [Candidatus Norongarragalinales archaeon]|nr:hypothetical protein [Candidatus Norongarragalinales archaeon]
MASEQNLLSELVKPHHRILVTGANTHYLMDPSVAHLCTLVDRSKGGKVTLLDIQTATTNALIDAQSPLRRAMKKSGIQEREITWFPEQVGLTQTFGDPVAYRKSVKELRSLLKIRMSLPGIRIADAFQTRLPDRSMDLVLDKMTHGQIARNSSDLDRLVREYCRVSAGRIVFISDKADVHRVESALANLDIRTTTEELDPDSSYRIGRTSLSNSGKNRFAVIGTKRV